MRVGNCSPPKPIFLLILTSSNPKKKFKLQIQSRNQRIFFQFWPNLSIATVWPSSGHGCRALIYLFFWMGSGIRNFKNSLHVAGMLILFKHYLGILLLDPHISSNILCHKFIHLTLWKVRCIALDPSILWKRWFAWAYWQHFSSVMPFLHEPVHTKLMTTLNHTD